MTEGASLAGKVALVTGGTRGIGRAIVHELARAGANVAFGYRESGAAAEEIAGQAGVRGVELEAIRVDLADEDGPQTVVDRTVARFGRIDILVVSAGVWAHAPLLEMRPELYDRIQRVNARGSFLLVQHAARHMVAGGAGGKIVLITSRGRLRPRPGTSAYAASKAAQHALVLAAAGELAQFGITVNEVAPGPVETEMNLGMREDPEQFRTLVDGVLLKRFGRPSEVATAVRFLVSDDSSFVTGATLVVDGGSTVF